MALTVRQLIVHSDRAALGTHRGDDVAQFTQAWLDALAATDARASMGRVGVCWDNAPAEAWFVGFKNELVHPIGGSPASSLDVAQHARPTPMGTSPSRDGTDSCSMTSRCPFEQGKLNYDKLIALGFDRSDRFAVRWRMYRPWVPELGMWAQWDWDTGPTLDGRCTNLFCAWLAWSRFRVVVLTWDKTLPTVIGCLDRAMHAPFGGAPTYWLTDKTTNAPSRSTTSPGSPSGTPRSWRSVGTVRVTVQLRLAGSSVAGRRSWLRR